MKSNLLYIDLFCGAGGTSTGVLESGAARVLACVNHDENAILSHKENHPDVLHFTEDIKTLDTNPIVRRVMEERRNDPEAKVVLWASCECTNFSNAKGGKPRDPDSRSLAEHLYRYIEAIDPDYVQVENVVEFLAWGPMIKVDGSLVPDKRRKGESFSQWFSVVESMGYKGGFRVFNAADFGAYTSRKRLFVLFAKSGLPHAWPRITHNRSSWKACKEVLNLDVFGASIFARKKALCDATLRRLEEGVRKFAKPQFVFRYMSGNGHVHSVDNPCVTLCTQKNLYLTSCKFMDNYFGRGYPSSIEDPVGTICTKEQRFPVTVVFLSNYYSSGGQLSEVTDPCPTLMTVPKQRVVQCRFLDQTFGQSRATSLDNPMPSLLTCSHYNVIAGMDAPAPFIRFTLDGVAVYEHEDGDSPAMLSLKRTMAEYGVGNIFMRPLSIDESLALMGFPKGYKLVGTKTQKRKFIGNAVEVNMAKHLVLALADALQGKEEA